MAQLDRMISAMVAHGGDALHLNEGEAATIEIKGSRQAVTKAVLSGPQILALLNEIATPAAAGMLESRTPTKFRYDTPEGLFLVRAMLRDTRWIVQIARDDKGDVERQSGTFQAVGDGNGKTAAAAPAATPAKAAPRQSGGQVSPAAPAAAVSSTAFNTGGTVAGATADASEARLQMDKLLRLLVEKGGSDLHLRCGERPIIRHNGEIVRLDGFPTITNDALEAMLYTIMPDRNKNEFRETHDTDFAYEIEGLARFRANAARERKGAAGV